MWEKICEQWTILPSMLNLKETRTEKWVARFVRWEIWQWTLVWKRISLWYYYSVFRKRNDEGPSISCLIISRTSCSEWLRFSFSTQTHATFSSESSSSWKYHGIFLKTEQYIQFKLFFWKTRPRALFATFQCFFRASSVISLTHRVVHR